MNNSCLPCALLKSARYQLVIVGIVDGSAENCRNVIIIVSFRIFFIIINQGFFDFVESLYQTKILDKMLQGLHPVQSRKTSIFHRCLRFHTNISQKQTPHSKLLSLEMSYLSQNRLSKPKMQAIFTTFYCNINQLPRSDPRLDTDFSKHLCRFS